MYHHAQPSVEVSEMSLGPLGNSSRGCSPAVYLGARLPRAYQLIIFLCVFVLFFLT